MSNSDQEAHQTINLLLDTAGWHIARIARKYS